MNSDDAKKNLDSALAPYLDTIRIEREQSTYWFNHSMASGKRYMELMEVNQKLREENRKLYMKLLGLEPD